MCCISISWSTSATSSSDDEEPYERSITFVGFWMTAADGGGQKVSFPLGGGSSSPSLKSAPKRSRADVDCAGPPPLHVVCHATGWERGTVQVAAESQGAERSYAGVVTYQNAKIVTGRTRLCIGDRAESGTTEVGISRDNNVASSNILAKVTEMTNLPARSIESRTGDLEKLGGQTDVSDLCTEAQAMENGSKIPEKASESARNSQTHPVEAQNCARRSQSGWRTSRVRRTCTSTQSVRDGTKTAARTRQIISITRNKVKLPNSPIGTET